MADYQSIYTGAQIDARLTLAGTAQQKESGKGLSTNDYTNAEKAKLAGIAAGAEVNVNADWDATSGDAVILHKPTVPSKTSQLTNDSGFLTSHQDISGKADKVSGAVSGDFAALDSNGNLTDSGKKASDFLTEHQSLAAYRTSAAQDVIDAAFITKSVSDLVNYYLKTDTYNRTEVDSLIAAVKQFTYEVVSTLPTASASTMNKIYLVPSSSSAAQNVKDEFITLETGGVYSWEQIGSTSVDLSNYYTKAQADAAFATAAQGALADSAYQKPAAGIPETDLADAAKKVRTATYGTTPFATMAAWLDNGDVVRCVMGSGSDMVGYVTYYSANKIHFLASSLDNGLGGEIGICVVANGQGSADVWSYGTFQPESQGNKTDSISASPSSAKYPSEYCLANALAGKADKVSNPTSGNLAALDANGNLADAGKAVPASGNWLHNIYTSLGATWDSSAQTWTLGSVTGLTNTEMDAIYAERQPMLINYTTQGAYAWYTKRAIFPIIIYGVGSPLEAGFTFYYASNLEELRFILRSTNGWPTTVSFYGSCAGIFQGCSSLKKIASPIRMFPGCNNTNTMFTDCSALTDVSFETGNVNANMFFNDCPNLTKASVLSLINGTATGANYTHTLNATVYNKSCVAGGEYYTDVQAALAEHTNVSLASA